MKENNLPRPLEWLAESNVLVGFWKGSVPASNEDYLRFGVTHVKLISLVDGKEHDEIKYIFGPDEGADDITGSAQIFPHTDESAYSVKEGKSVYCGHVIAKTGQIGLHLTNHEHPIIRFQLHKNWETMPSDVNYLKVPAAEYLSAVLKSTQANRDTLKESERPDIIL